MCDLPYNELNKGCHNGNSVTLVRLVISTITNIVILLSVISSALPPLSSHSLSLCSLYICGHL